MTGRVSNGCNISAAFPINLGLKQGCVLAPTLFTLHLGAVLETMSANLANGVYIQTCSDGKLFNLARLKAETRTNALCFRELLYADDTALVATNYNNIQEIVNQFLSAATMFSLKINTKNRIDAPTTPLQQPSPKEHRHFNKCEALRCTDSFTYLGSAVTNTNSPDLKIEWCVQSAIQSIWCPTKMAVVMS